MPLYEYRCCECRKIHERFYSTAGSESSDIKACPECGSTEIRKVISAFGLGAESGRKNSGMFSGLKFG